MKIKAGIIKRIHVNQHIIKKNKKCGLNDPPLTIKTTKNNFKANRIKILGSSELIHSIKPLGCGAVCWIETKGEVEYE